MAAPTLASPLSERQKTLDFAQLVLAEQPGLLRLARRLVWDDEEAKDVLQQALTDAVEKVGTLEDRGAASAWLRRIVTHRALSVLRRRKVWRTLAALVGVEPEPARQPDDDLERGRHRAKIAAAVERLSPKQQAAFSLRYLEGLSLDQVADAMTMNRGTVRVHLQRAVSALRRSGALEQST